YWIYPIQTVVCAALLVAYWRYYPARRPRRVWLALLVGVVVFVLWISPQSVFGFAARTEGFNPGVVPPYLYWPTVLFRFARLAVVVPLVEEVFWRGFLLRYLVRNDFEDVPFGAFS